MLEKAHFFSKEFILKSVDGHFSSTLFSFLFLLFFFFEKEVRDFATFAVPVQFLPQNFKIDHF